MQSILTFTEDTIENIISGKFTLGSIELINGSYDLYEEIYTGLFILETDKVHIKNIDVSTALEIKATYISICGDIVTHTLKLVLLSYKILGYTFPAIYSSTFEYKDALIDVKLGSTNAIQLSLLDV